ncbi:S8 family peptidase [Rugosimonospora africana]|uniref:Serine protease n=1 Tax=Rugosimonospora africana TaxID=556532 RepID=A0A8J3R3U5_9ACTN|nr:S8 family serine peptidase [Rugosimonospora africana]GIH19596.1 serine protease [Rugosimonospora africana]
MRRWVPAVTAGLLVLMLGVESPHAGAAPASRSVPAPLPTGRTYRVTLLTGDVVTLRTAAKGCPKVSVRPAHQGDAVAESCGPDGHVHVMPAGLGRLRGKVDPALFDVTTLVQQGYDDAHSSDLPLIVRYAAGHSRSAFSAAIGQQRDLPSVHGVAVREPKSRATTLAPPLLSTGSSAGPADVDHIWLDRRVRVSQSPRGTDTPSPVGPAPGTRAGRASSAADPTGPVAQDLVQIGAPVAWRAGETGKGVRVAVLDTGVDATHPDLAGKIVASMNFTGDDDGIADRVGHGTHVAATIAGGGVASGGRYRGVAPDAQLMIGKVLGDDGTGSDSQVIEGMQWAAPQARVVSMSLGGDFSDGSDPVSMALDSLSAQYGTLFVVAAGNDGPAGGSIDAPGSAAAALTVGAVDATDTVAGFSSRGPQSGALVMKPEIVAPGVDIVSARASGTDIGSPIDQWYAQLSGTSMATPHVAGAAAILAQAQPGWGAQQLKDALVGAADPAHGDAYAQGAGRVDIPRALSTPAVPSTAIEDFGTLRYPQSGTTQASIGWTNPGTTPVTLNLTVAGADRAGTPVPAGTLRLSARAISIPPGGTGSVQVTVDQGTLAAKPGYYAGMLTAQAGTVSVRTPVAFFIEPPSFDLTLKQTVLPGSAPGSTFSLDTVVNLDDPDLFNDTFFGDLVDLPEGFTVRVPAGRYSVTGDVSDTSVDGVDRDALAGTPEVLVAGPTTVTFDAAHAVPVIATIAGVDTELQHAEVNLVQAGRHGDPWWSSAAAFGPQTGGPQVFTTPMPDADVGYLHASEAFGLRAPGTGLSPFEYTLGRFLPDGIPADPTYRLNAVDRSRLARIDQTFNRLDIPGTTTGHQRYLVSPDGFLVGEDVTEEVPAHRTDYVTPGLSWIDEALLSDPSGQAPLAGMMLDEEAPATYPTGSRTAKVWFNQPLHPDWNDAPNGIGCQPQPFTRTLGNLHVAVASMVDQHDRFNCLASFLFVYLGGADRSLTLYRDGQQIGRRQPTPDQDTVADFTIPTDPGSYRLVYDEDTNASGFPISTHSTTAWTFRSTAPTGADRIPVAVLSVDYALPLDTNNHPTGRTATFTVRQARGAPAQPITGLTVWTSTDQGDTWTPAPATAVGGDRFTAQLPPPSPGQTISLRVNATGANGSSVDQTIVDAYHVPA